jgi:hypothetical protein
VPALPAFRDPVSLSQIRLYHCPALVRLSGLQVSKSPVGKCIMSHMNSVFNGVVHGKMIELDHEPGLPDGHQVRVTVQPANEIEKLSPGEGLRRSAGAWADDAEELNVYLEWNRQNRKARRRGIF